MTADANATSDVNAPLTPDVYARWRATPARCPCGAIYFPPLGWAARHMARIDPLLARLGTFGAAFLCVASRKRSLS